MNRYYLIILLLITTANASFSQKKGSKDDPEPDPNISQKDNDYIDRQDLVFLDTITAILRKYPPVARDGSERSHAKLLMDAVAHDQYAAFRKPVRRFFHERVDLVINDLEKSHVTKGAVIWKVYNMGFILRTKSVTIAFDLVSGASSGSKGFEMNQSQMDRLVKQCDILFISHRHEDHAEKDIAERFLELGLPVIAPEQVWKDEKISDRIIHPERNGNKTNRIALKSGKSLDYTVFPGHQLKPVDVNVVLVRTPEGISVAHLGDQINEGDFMEDFEWIDNVAKTNKVDIMIPNCWTNDIVRIARGFNPRVIMPGHELELGHSVHDKVPFWGDNEFQGSGYPELKKSNYPVIVLVWGESYHYYQHEEKK